MASKNLFRKLNSMPIRKRIEVASTPEGKSALDALTPTEFAELFPKYYQRNLPDVGGFRLATTRAAAEKQRSFTDRLMDRVSSAEKIAGEAYQTIKRKLGMGQNPLPSLTPEQASAYEKLKAGGLSPDSPEGKMFAGLTDQQLASIGISRGKDNNGRSVFNYSQPDVTQKEAIDKMSEKSGGNLKQMIDEAASKHGIDPRIMYGIVRGESGHGERYDRNLNDREDSYGPFQMNRASWNPGLGSDFERETGKSVVDPSTLAAQADWIAKKIASKGDGARRWVASQWYGYGSNVGGPKDFAARAAGGDANWNSSWGTMGAGRGGGEPNVKPEGPNGQYSEKQIANMMDQLRNEKNDARKQQLANLLQGAIENSDTATVKGTSTSKWDEIKPLHGSSQSMCGRGVLHLAQQLFPDNKALNVEKLGSNANGVADGSNPIFANSGMWKTARPIGEDKLTPDFLKNLPDGTIIAAGGGRADGAGHIQMKVGGRWVSDFPQKGFLADHPGRDYRGYSILEVSEKGHAELAARGFYQPTKDDVSQVTAAPKTTAPPPPMPVAKQQPEVPVNPLPTPQEAKKEQQTAVVNGPVAPKSGAASATPSGTPAPASAPTATVNPAAAAAAAKAAPAKPSLPSSYTVDRAGFIAAIKNTPEFKNNPLSFMASEQMIIDGFNSSADVQAAGVYYDAGSGIMKFKDPANPQIQQIMKTIHTETFMKPIVEKKAEAPTPEPKKVAEAPKPAAPQTPAAAPEPKKVAEAAPTPAPEPKKVAEAPPEPKKVKTAATGGSFNVPDGGIAAYPIGGLKGDNTVVVNKKQEPLFTMNSRESATYNANQNRVDVSPSQKPDGNSFGPSQNLMKNEITALRHEMSAAFSSAGERSVTPTRAPIPSIPNDNPTFVMDQTNQGKKPWNNAAFERAMNRTRMFESGDSLNNHFSTNNTNG